MFWFLIGVAVFHVLFMIELFPWPLPVSELLIWWNLGRPKFVD